MNIPAYVDESHKQFWIPFENWCRNNGVNEEEEDMRNWWYCFISGATSMYLKIKRGEVK